MIITLGMCCRVSETLIRLNKKESNNLFEWMRSVDFNDILCIIEKILNNKPILLTNRKELPNNIFLDDTKIHTSHYTKEHLEGALQRRIIRFLEAIRGEEPILFIREDFINDETGINQIEKFYNLITTANPSCRFKLLLLSENKTEFLQHPILIHEKYTQDAIDNVLQKI